MLRRSIGIRMAVIAAMAIGPVGWPEAQAKGGRGGGGHPGGGGARAKVPAMHRMNQAPAYKPPQMPRAMAQARNNNVAHASNTNNVAHANNNMAAAHANARAGTLAATGGTRSATGTANGRVAGSPAAGGTRVAANSTGSGSSTPYAYTYGHGSSTHSYQAHGYGRGYRNSSYGRRSGYGRSQGTNRALVSRLRAVHSGLARLNHDYRGHRVRAMHSVSMAIRQLSHRTTSANSGMNNGQGIRQAGIGNNRVAGNNGNRNGRQNQNMTQAQSDSRMSQALRTLQGVHMQLGSQASNNSTNARARGHVLMAGREIHTALTVR